jgi:hypothetical protein
MGNAQVVGAGLECDMGMRRASSMVLQQLKFKVGDGRAQKKSRR